MSGSSWSSHRLVEFLTAIVACEEPSAASAIACELVAEEFDAEVGAVVIGGDVSATVGFGTEGVPAASLLAVPRGADVGVLPGLGACQTLTAQWKGAEPGRLLVARRDSPFGPEERHLMLGMARALGLSLDRIAALSRERGRQRVLEVLLGIQRQISQGAPLHEILDAVTAGASVVLGGRPVELRFDGEREATTAPGQSATVHIKGERAGELVASAAPGVALAEQERDLLRVFAAQAGLALTDARAAEQMREAMRDAVTGLPNRRLLVDRLGQSLARAAAGGLHGVCVLFIDLDRFKAVNDSLGHSAGDELLTAAGRRIRGATRQTDVVARFGGDEFAVVLEGGDTRQRAWAVADRVITALRDPFVIDGNVVYIGSTIGIAHADGRSEAEPLLSDADIAMYEAKRAGGGQARAFDPTMRVALRRRLELETELRDALANGELSLHYQPIVAIEPGRSTGVEALLRWSHPEHGPVSPADFIPVAEATGAIVAIGRWVLRETCAQLARWRTRWPDLTAHVNVSAHQLRDPAFVDDVDDALKAVGLSGTALTLEITESLLIDDHDSTLNALQALKSLGVAIALDDFGTGFSSLSYLHRFPVDTLKIDRSFVSGDASGAGGHQLVRTIVELGRVFELETVAEGVETADQCEHLRELGCASAQGYLFARPMDAAALERFLAAERDAEAVA